MLGPILFTMYYTVPFGDITRHHGIMHHFYVDDTQLCIILNPWQDFSAQLQSLGQYINDMWMHLNILKLNDNKTEVLIDFNNSLNHPSSVSVKIGNSSVNLSQSVTNLGCNFDRRLNMNDFIMRKSQSSEFINILP